MKPTIIIHGLFAVMMLISCQKSELAIEENKMPTGPSATTGSVNKSLMVQLVNDIRKKGCQCGDTYYYPVPSIAWSNQLEAAAFTHSADMFENDFFSHTAPDGSNGGIRIQKAGYSWNTYGENIASGYKSESEVVKGWLESAGHCKNIMNKNFKEMGVARVGNYWTQEFGAK